MAPHLVLVWAFQSLRARLLLLMLTTKRAVANDFSSMRLTYWYKLSIATLALGLVTTIVLALAVFLVWDASLMRRFVFGVSPALPIVGLGLLWIPFIKARLK